MSTKNIVNNVYQFPGPKKLAQAVEQDAAPARSVGPNVRAIGPDRGPSRGRGQGKGTQPLTHLYVNVVGLLLGLYRTSGETGKERTLAECLKQFLNQTRTDTLVRVPPEIAADAHRVTGVDNLVKVITAIQRESLT